MRIKVRPPSPKINGGLRCVINPSQGWDGKKKGPPPSAESPFGRTAWSAVLVVAVPLAFAMPMPVITIPAAAIPPAAIPSPAMRAKILVEGDIAPAIAVHPDNLGRRAIVPVGEDADVHRVDDRLVGVEIGPPMVLVVAVRVAVRGALDAFNAIGVTRHAAFLGDPVPALSAEPHANDRFRFITRVPGDEKDHGDLVVGNSVIAHNDDLAFGH